MNKGRTTMFVLGAIIGGCFGYRVAQKILDHIVVAVAKGMNAAMADHMSEPIVL